MALFSLFESAARLSILFYVPYRLSARLGPMAFGSLMLLGVGGINQVQAAETTGTTASIPTRLVFAFQRQNDPRSVQESANQVADFLTQRVGVPVEVMVPTNYGASVQALISNHAQVAYVSALPFLLAQQEAPVRLIVAEERQGRADYDSVFVVRKDSQVTTLSEARGKRMVFTSPTSMSGYVMPYDRLIAEGFLQPGQDPRQFFGQVTFGGGYDRALLAVVNGQADVAAVSDYTMEGETADLYLKREDREQLRVLERVPGVPTHAICLRTDLPEELQERIQQALLALSAERPDLLQDVYGASRLIKVDDAHAAKAAQAVERTGLQRTSLVP
jgi:phosphonate transport system substrate-binding protein